MNNLNELSADVDLSANHDFNFRNNEKSSKSTLNQTLSADIKVRIIELMQQTMINFVKSTTLLKTISEFLSSRFSENYTDRSFSRSSHYHTTFQIFK